MAERIVTEIMLINEGKHSFKRGYIDLEEIGCIAKARGILRLNRPVNLIIPGIMEGEIVTFTDICVRLVATGEMDSRLN